MHDAAHLHFGRSHQKDAKSRFASLLILLCCTMCASAQYHYSVWTAEDGLPQNEIRGVSQTQDGYLWLSTLDGLARFDGVNFTIFNRSNTKGIDSNRFSGMYKAPNGDLWLPAEGSQLTRYHKGVFRTYQIEVLGITGDDAGHLWILQHTGILGWDEATDSFRPFMSPYPKLAYRIIHWLNAGFWAADQNGLHCFLRGRSVTYPLPASLKPDTISIVSINENDAAWIETVDGSHLHITSDGLSSPLLNPATLAPDSFVDVRGHTWKTTIGPHLARSMEFVSSGHVVTLPFTHIFEDREKNIWLATEGQGLYRLQKQSVQAFSKDQGLGSGNIYPIFEDNTGTIWIGAWNSGLARLKDGKLTNFTVADGLPNALPTALAQDSDGHIWVATHGGLAMQVDKRFQSPAGPPLPLRALVQAIYQDHDGTLWFGTTRGLLSYRGGQAQLFTTQNGLATDDVRTIIEDPQGGLWIGGYGGLTRLHQGQFTHWTQRDGLPSSSLRSLYEDSAGVLWIGTYDGGLGRFKDGKFTCYTEADGLFNNGVFQILEDSHGELWMSCNHGIYRVNKAELNQFAAGERHAINSIAYGKSDGMLTVECNGGLWPAGIKAHDGKLWFPTQDGAAVIDPNNVREDSQPPPVVIEAATIDRRPVSMTGPLRIPPGSENVQIQYTGLSFIHSEQIRFKYKLEGLDSRWVDAGPRRTAYYSDLPPGKYTFRVIAGSSDGLWNMEGKSLNLTVQAPFYRTWWFIALMMLAFAAFIYASWHRRVAQLQNIQAMQQLFSQQLIASQENERKRIAAELHDSIGQRLVVINNLALFFLRSHANVLANQGDENWVQEISVEATSAIQEAREISYNLRPFQLDRLGLTKAIEGLIRSVSGASGIVVSSQIENIDDLFPEDMRINFYRIVQESLNNVMKHSHATEVKIRLQKTDDRVIFSIRDNGRGFPSSPGSYPAGQGGFGMTGMAERANLLGGNLEVRSEAGLGTMLIVTIFVSRANHG